MKTASHAMLTPERDSNARVWIEHRTQDDRVVIKISDARGYWEVPLTVAEAGWLADRLKGKS
jgi:hypothetical protein